MKLDSYWWVDETVPEDEQTISAICVECKHVHNLKAVYWNGDYADDLIACKLCKKIIYQKEDDETATPV